jgi:hypothetical protein
MNARYPNLEKALTDTSPGAPSAQEQTVPAVSFGSSLAGHTNLPGDRLVTGAVDHFATFVTSTGLPKTIVWRIR